jgi:hypothetical protein
VSIQIGEQLERRQGRVRALASVSDSSVSAVELVRRIALTQQEVCRRSAVTRSSSWCMSGRTCGWCAGDRRRLFAADQLRREVAEYAVCPGRSERWTISI